MAPQGIGAAAAMAIGGRMADRVGGGKVAVVSLVILTLASLPFAFVSETTPYWLLGGLLVFRGVGIGGTMMPAMAAAYAVLSPSAVPRATSSLNVVQRIGGSLGTAILAVVLQGQIADARSTGAPLADAFAHTFGWSVLMSALGLIPACLLVLATRRVPTAVAQDTRIAA
jgi:MFS family permease